MGEDDAESDGDRSEAGWEPNNIADLSKTKFEQKMAQKENSKSRSSQIHIYISQNN